MDDGRNTLSAEMAETLLHVLVLRERAGGRRIAEQIMRERAAKRIEQTAKKLTAERLAEPTDVLLAGTQLHRAGKEEKK